MEKIPAVIVEDFKNNDLDLFEKYKGKSLLLLIYNNQCLGCTGRAIPLAYEFQQEFKGIEVVGVHTHFTDRKITEADVKSIFTTGELPFSIYLDKGRTVYDAFNSEGTPQWVLLTKDRKVFRSIFGSQTNAHNRLLYALESLVDF